MIGLIFLLISIGIAVYYASVKINSLPPSTSDNDNKYSSDNQSAGQIIQPHIPESHRLTHQEEGLFAVYHDKLQSLLESARFQGNNMGQIQAKRCLEDWAELKTHWLRIPTAKRQITEAENALQILLSLAVSKTEVSNSQWQAFQNYLSEKHNDEAIPLVAKLDLPNTNKDIPYPSLDKEITLEEKLDFILRNTALPVSYLDKKWIKTIILDYIQGSYSEKELSEDKIYQEALYLFTQPSSTHIIRKLEKRQSSVLDIFKGVQLYALVEKAQEIVKNHLESL